MSTASETKAEFSLMERPGIGNPPHEPSLGQWAGRPAQIRGTAKPALNFPVGRVVFVRQGDQHVDVEKKGLHHSSDSSALTCSVAIFFSPRRSKTGSPSTYLMRGLLRVLRTISSETALLSVRFRL